MRINVLGLGESLKLYKADECYTVGVNDIYKYHAVDSVVCVDPPIRFTNDRVKTILNGTQKEFITNRPEWLTAKGYRLIDLANVRGDVSLIDTKYPYSTNSVFLAVVHAFKLGAKEIVIYGADFRTHKGFECDEKQKHILEHYKKLNDALLKRGVKTFICSDYSILSNVLPVHR